MSEVCKHCGEEDPDNFGFLHTVAIEFEFSSGIEEMSDLELLQAVRETANEADAGALPVVSKKVVRKCWNCWEDQ